MPSFTGNTGLRTPFGQNQPLRSTKNMKYESYTYSAAVHPEETVDDATVKVLQPGMAIASITSGAEAGKVGPFTLQVANTDGRQTAANLVGINNTFLPTQLLNRDVEIAVVYDGATYVQAQCFELDASGGIAALSTGTATALNGRLGGSLTFV